MVYESQVSFTLDTLCPWYDRWPAPHTLHHMQCSCLPFALTNHLRQP